MHSDDWWTWLLAHLWPLAGSNFVSFALGLTSGLLLQRRAEKRAGRKRLSDRVLRPLRTQLAEIESEVLARKRPAHWNANFWRELNSSGDLLRVKRLLGEKLQTLFGNQVPKYDTIWQRVSDSLNTKIQGWDREYGTTFDPRLVVRVVPWWDFLSADICVPPYKELGAGPPVRLWNSFLENPKLQQLGVTLEKFLEQRWHEAQSDPLL